MSRWGLLAGCAALWLLAMVAVAGGLHALGDAAEMLLLAVLLYGFPGGLTLALLRLLPDWSRVQLLALAFGIGLTEALLLGQAAVLLGLGTPLLAGTILLLAAGKIAVLVWRHPRDIVPAVTEVTPLNSGFLRLPDVSSLVQIGLFIVPLVALLNNLALFGVYTWTPGDSWNYTQVIVQFVDNPGDMNIQPGITAISVNIRLTWNSWLYNHAMLVRLANADLVLAHQRDLLPFAYLLAALAYAAVGRELLRDRQFGWLAAALQLGFVLSATGTQAYFTERLLEDKFFAYLVFFPLVFLVLLRAVRDAPVRDAPVRDTPVRDTLARDALARPPARRHLLLFIVLSFALALIHPINPLMLLATGGAFVLYRWLVLRSWAEIRRTLPLLLWLLLLLLYPLGLEVLLSRITADEVLAVAPALEQSRSVPLSYFLQTAWAHTWWQADFLLYYALSSTVIFAASWWGLLRRGQRSARADANAATATLAPQFIFAVSAAIVALLWVPPFAAFWVMALSRSQNWRLFMLIPAGYGMALALWWGLRWLQMRFKTPELLTRLAIGVGVLLLATVLFRWNEYFPVKDGSNRMTVLEQEAFFATRELVGSGRVLSTVRLSQAIPTLFPDATTPFAGRLVPDETQQTRLLAAVAVENRLDVDAALLDNGVEYLLLPRTAPLETLLENDYPCCVLLYENAEVALYAVRYSVPLTPVTPDEITQPLEVQFSMVGEPFARLRGAALLPRRGGMQITLYWEPLAQSAQPYTVFVHLIGIANPASGSPLWAQDDHPPRLNQTPTTQWTPGDLLRDAYWLDTAGLPAGEYTVYAGMYGADGVRLPVMTGDGQPVGDSAALLRLVVDANGQITALPPAS